PADHDDDHGGGAGRGAVGDRLWRGGRAAAAARHLDRRRALGQPGADPLHDAGHLPLPRPLPAVGLAPPWRRASAGERPPPRGTRRMMRPPSSRRKPGPTVMRVIAVARQHRRARKFSTLNLAQKWVPAFAGTTVMALLAGCAVGPDYRRP